MEQTEIPVVEQLDMEMEEVMTQCIGLLLDALYHRSEEGSEEYNSKKALGEIRIITDPRGGIGERIAQKGDSRGYAVFFACVPTQGDAYELELQLILYALNIGRLKDAIRAICPDYERQEFADVLDDAVGKISQVLLAATVIPAGSPTYAMLHRGAVLYC